MWISRGGPRRVCSVALYSVWYLASLAIPLGSCTRDVMPVTSQESDISCRVINMSGDMIPEII